MVKLLLKICLNFIKKPCNFETEFDKYWFNFGMACILFKFYQYIYYPTNFIIGAADVEFLKFIS